MRKWQDLAAPDDPNSWADVAGMWPTRRGTYEAADVSIGTAVTGIGTNQDLVYAFAFGLSTAGAAQEYVVSQPAGQPRIYSWDGSSLTNNSPGGGALETTPIYRGHICMARYGSVALLAYSTPTGKKIKAATSFGANFADIAGAPTDKDILAVQSNAVLAFSSGSNTWAASDVGDYTNWSTGEAASGTIFDHPGNISAAVSYGNDVYVFKPGSIHRMTYVGGVVKWQVQKAFEGIGAYRPPTTTTVSTFPTQDWAVATNHGIVFYGGNGYIYLYDGATEPRCLNPLTTIPVETINGVFTYDPSRDVVCIAPSFGSSDTGLALSPGASTTYTSLYYYYSFPFGAWGSGVGCAREEQVTSGQTHTSGVLRGDFYNRVDNSPKPVFWNITDAISGTIYRNAPSGGNFPNMYLQTTKVGSPDKKTTFTRVTPLARRRTAGGTVSLSMNLFTERSDTTPNSTRSITESTTRQRFDLLGGASTDCFAQFKLSMTNLDLEVDDLMIATEPAGTD